MLLYTDGITEAMNPQQMPFSNQRMAELLRSHPHRSPPELIALITQQVEQFRSHVEQSDDITLLAFQYLGIPYAEGELLNFAIDKDVISEFKEQWQ